MKQGFLTILTLIPVLAMAADYQPDEERLYKTIGDVELNDLGARSAMFWLPADADLQHAASGRD